MVSEPILICIPLTSGAVDITYQVKVTMTSIDSDSTIKSAEANILM